MITAQNLQVARTTNIGFGLVILMAVILSISAISSVKQNNELLDKIISVNNTKTELIYTMRYVARNRIFTLTAITLEKDALVQDELVQQFRKQALEFITARNNLIALGVSEKEKKILQLQAIAANTAVQLQNKVLELALNLDQKHALNTLVQEAIPAQNFTHNHLEKLLQTIVNKNRLTESTGNKKAHFNLRLIIFSAVFVIILSLLIARFIRKRQNKILSQLEDTSDHLKNTLAELNYQKLAIDEHAIVSITDNRGDIIYVNKKFQDISQYSEQQLLGQNHRLLNSGYHDKEFFRDMWRTIAKGKPWHGEIKNINKNGQFYWVATTIMPSLDKEGKPERYVSIRTDITPVKEAELKLVNMNYFLEQRVADRTKKLSQINTEVEHDRKVLEVVTKSTLDVKGELFFKTMVNCMAAAMNVRCAFVAKVTDLKIAQAETIALWAGDHFHPKLKVHMPDAPSYNLLTDSFAYFPENLKELFPNISFFHEQNIESYFALPFRNSEGEISGFIAIMNDKPLIGIHKLRRTLELFAMRCGAEFERQKNEHALKEAYRHKSEFLASMSHELRTPLNSIIGFSKLLSNGIDGPVNDEQKESLDLIYRGGKHLLMLISEILDMSKLEAGRMEIQAQDVELQPFLDDVVATISSLLNEKNLQFSTEFNADIITQACFDQMRIKQVLLNLLSNAVKFTEQGQVKLICDMADHHIDLLPENRQKEILKSTTPYLLMAVTDSGIGIAPDNLKMVFDDFRQVDGSSTRDYGGTGLGLAISRRLVELHHGEIWVKSTVDQGSTFAFILPVFSCAANSEELDQVAKA